MLLYSTLGDMWTYDSRITYSFMPDGTSVGGTPSALFSTLNAVAPTATWEAQFEQAASLWETAANVNLALVPDGGEAVGTNGDQQDDPRFGDIRIGAIPLGSGILAETFLPPPANGGTDAGDILFNSTAPWAVNNTYDMMTVAAHEFGHALGLGESTVTIGRDVRHLQRDQAGADQRRHLRHRFDLWRPSVRPVQQQRLAEHLVPDRDQSDFRYQRSRPDRAVGPGQYHPQR